MGYWKSKVLPKIKMVFDKNGAKKAAAAEACKSFYDVKVEIDKEFEEKMTEIQPKVVEIYEAAPAKIKSLVKDQRTAERVKKHPAAVTKFLEQLAKIDFPGAKKVSEASSAFGPALVSGPVLFVMEKVSSFVATTEEEAAAAPESSSSRKEEEVEVAEGEDKENLEVEKEVEEEAATTAVAAASVQLTDPTAEEMKAPEAQESQAPAEEEEAAPKG